MSALRDELASFFFWLAARLEKKHKEAVVRYYTQPWAHMGKSAVTTWQIEENGSLTEIKREDVA